MALSPNEMCFTFTKAALQHDTRGDPHFVGMVYLHPVDAVHLGSNAYIAKEKRR